MNFIYVKNFLRYCYRNFLIFNVLIKIYFNFIFRDFFIKKNKPRIFYAGAKKGNIGGPFAKLKKLNVFFPEYKFKFNIVYVLSNSPFLSSKSISILKSQKLPIFLNQNGVFYPAWFKEDWKKQNLKIANV